MTHRNHHWILTGGIGSGKSAVRMMLAESGVATIDADEVGHEVLEPDGPAYGQVTAAWPDVVVDGHIDRSLLADIVFGDLNQLRHLESLTHPHIFGRINQRVEGFEDVVVVEMPLLRSGLGPGWRRVVVDADDETRIRRAVARGFTEEDARARMASQPTRAEWLAAADLVVPNHGTLNELREAIAQLLPVL